MNEEIEVDRYYLIDDEQFFWAGIDVEEVKYGENLKEAISFETLEKAQNIKQILKEEWGEDFNIVKINFEFIK